MIELKLDELEFEETNHIYRLNGVEIPSVSRIIQPVSMATYGSINEAVLAKAAAKGTAVHKAIENYNTFGAYSVDDELKGYVDAYLLWECEHRPDVQANELMFYHKIMRYAGTCDMLAYVDGKLNLMDFKTSYKVVDKNYRLQLEAYTQGLSTHGINVEEKRILHLKKDGTYEDIVYPLNDIEALKVFGACKAIYDYNRW